MAVPKKKMQEGGTTISNVTPPTTTTMNVDEYMGQQVTNPTMPAQSQFVPQTQAIQPGEEVSPEAYALQGQPDIPISQATTTQAQGPAVSPAAQVSPALIGTKHTFIRKSFIRVGFYKVLSHFVYYCFCFFHQCRLTLGRY